MIMIIHGHSFLGVCASYLCAFPIKNNNIFWQGGFKIYTENEAAKQYFFCANTEKEREEWVDAISNAK